jgi:hypothetical protein
MTLRVTPALLHRIQLRCVGRKPLKCKPVRAVRLEPLRRRSMSIQAIQYNDDLAFQLPMQRSKEPNDLIRFEACLSQLEVERGAALCRTDCQGRDRRDTPMMFRRDNQNGRLPSRSPSALAVRLQQEAAFIDENDASLAFSPPFLCGANSLCAIVQQPLVLAPSLVAQVSDKTSSTCSVSATRRWDRRTRRTYVRSTVRSENTSRDYFQSHASEPLARAWRQVASAVPRSAASGAQDAALPPVLRRRHSPEPWPNDTRSWPKRLRHGQRRLETCLLAIAAQRPCVSLPARQGYQEFS